MELQLQRDEKQNKQSKGPYWVDPPVKGVVGVLAAGQTIKEGLFTLVGLSPTEHSSASPEILVAATQHEFGSSVERYLIHDIGTSSSLLSLYASLNSQIIDLSERVLTLEKQTNVISTKIFDLASDKYELKNYIDVILKIYSDEVLAIIPELELYGEGTNEIYALDDLKQELIDLYEDLNSVPAKNLSKKFKAWKKVINFFIEEKNGNK